MGRPSKKGVEYFQHDTDASESKTIFIIENLFGNDGYAAWFKLLECLGKTRGIYLDCRELD